MKAVGIVAEYNPFHLGHLYNLNKIKESGADEVLISVISGDFVQRGEPAVLSKFARAEAAVRCGVDLVVELPSVWSLQSAEAYAAAAIDVLSSLKVSRLGFGTETDDFKSLEEIAVILTEKQFEASLSAAVKEKKELSYASVRETVLRSFIGEKADLIKTPNNILAIEYMKTVNQKGYDISFSPVRRIGSGHDDVSDGAVRSASQLREMLLNGESLAQFVPVGSYTVIREETEKGRAPVALESMEQAMVSRLRNLQIQDLMRVKDCDEELAHRIKSAVYQNYDLKDTFLSAKSKKYALSRIRRICICAALGITKEMQNSKLPYIRILAAGPKGQSYIRELKNARPEIPVVTKPADLLQKGDRCRETILMDSSIHDFYVLGYTNREERQCGTDFRRSPFMF